MWWINMMKMFENWRHPRKKIVIHTKKSTRSLLQNLTHSLQLSFPHWVKVILSGIGPAMARYKVNCFHLLVACSQSSFTSVWTSLATQELQISFQCWWTRFGNCIDIWWDVRGIHIQLKPLKKAPKVQLIGMWRFLFSGLEFMLFKFNLMVFIRSI